MSVPDEIKWTTHRPVILAAPDWPEMAALKEHATSLGADVEVSPMVRSKNVNIVWVPMSFTGSAANASWDLHAEMLAGTVGELAYWMGRLSATMMQARTSLSALFQQFERRERVARMHRAYRARRV